MALLQSITLANRTGEWRCFAAFWSGVTGFGRQRVAERFVPMREENILKPIVPAGVEVRASSRPSPKVDPAQADHLVRRAHRVLVHYLPGAQLPSELSKVRAMLDAHMFGRDKRTQRDDVVEIAREIDSLRASQVR
jgi:hypothetical protein